MAGCSTCPDYIVSATAAKSYEVLDKIQRIKYLTSIFNRLSRDVVNQLLADLQALVDLIPDPPSLTDLTDYINLITCPLTPLAIVNSVTIRSASDPTKFDPNVMTNKDVLSRLDPRTTWNQHTSPELARKASQIQALYDEALARIDSYDLRELKNEMDFTQRYDVSTTVIGVGPYTLSGSIPRGAIVPSKTTVTIQSPFNIVFQSNASGGWDVTATNGHTVVLDPAKTSTYINYTDTPGGSTADAGQYKISFTCDGLNQGTAVTVQYSDKTSSPLSIDGAVQKLRNSPAPKSPLAQIVRRYLQEIYRALGGDPAQFAVDIAFCMAQGAYVKATCPALYFDQYLPFYQLEQALTTFSWDGLLPSGMDASVQRFMNIIAQAWAKVMKWVYLGYTVI